MDLSIIIVNWNSIEFTKNCIASLYATTQGLNYEIIVVDNASSDDCHTLSQTFPEVKLVRSDRNIGFARANNLGVEHSQGAKVLFLNPDTLILKDAIAKMVLALDSAPDMGAVGARLLNGDLTLQVSCVQPFPTIPNQLLAIDWFKRGWPTLRLWGTDALFSSAPGLVREVEVVSGACLMVKRDVFQHVQGFSPEYFMYAEEVDLCYKIRRAGRKICHVSDANVVHFGGQSTKKSNYDFFADVMMRESIFRLFRKFRGPAYAQVYRAALFSSAVARLLILSPLLAFPNRLLRRDAILRSFQKWRKIAAWSLALEGWTRQFDSARTHSATASKN
jgi:GT2 family glycosyltransferase